VNDGLGGPSSVGVVVGRRLFGADGIEFLNSILCVFVWGPKGQGAGGVQH
jgi:hypothetical protein